MLQSHVKKKESIIDLTRFMSKQIRVKMNGGREGMLVNSARTRVVLVTVRHADATDVHVDWFALAVVGTLRGSDPLVNLVLEDTVEYLRDPRDLSLLTDQTRALGLVVCRGTQVSFVCPVDGSEEIENPFVQAAAEQPVI